MCKFQEFNNNITLYKTNNNSSILNQWLKGIGKGTTPTMFENIIALDSAIIATTPEEVIDFVYNDFQMHIDNTTYFKDRALMASTNQNANLTNEQLPQKIPQPAPTYNSINTILGDPDDAQ